MSNKHARPFSNDGRWLSLSAVAGDADLVTLVETQVHEVGFRSSLFFPMGRLLKPQIYSCSGKSNGIFIFANPNSIADFRCSVLQQGRLLRANFIFGGRFFTLYAIYLSAAALVDRLTTLSLLETDIREQTQLLHLAEEIPNIIITGDLNL